MDFEAACSVYIRFRGVNGYSPREVGEGSDDGSDIFVLMPFAPELKPIMRTTSRR